MSREAKDRYERTVDPVRALVAKADPDELVVLGAPADEYDGLVADLARRLPNGDDLTAENLFGTWAGFGGTQRAHDLAVELCVSQSEVLPAQ